MRSQRSRPQRSREPFFSPPKSYGNLQLSSKSCSPKQNSTTTFHEKKQPHQNCNENSKAHKAPKRGGAHKACKKLRARDRTRGLTCNSKFKTLLANCHIYIYMTLSHKPIGGAEGVPHSERRAGVGRRTSELFDRSGGNDNNAGNLLETVVLGTYEGNFEEIPGRTSLSIRKSLQF